MDLMIEEIRYILACKSILLFCFTMKSCFYYILSFLYICNKKTSGGYPRRIAQIPCAGGKPKITNPRVAPKIGIPNSFLPQILTLTTAHRRRPPSSPSSTARLPLPATRRPRRLRPAPSRERPRRLPSSAARRFRRL